MVGPATARARASIADVAAVAGVSTQTVSRVSTGSPAVRPATRERVLAAMAELGYTPNHAARALRSGTFGTLGLVAHQLARTGESRTTAGVVDAARREGYTLALVDLASPTGPEVESAVLRLEHQSIDGLVIIRAETATPETLRLPPRMPVVVSDSRFIGHHPTVGADQRGGAAAAVDHLLALGHRTVHHVAGPADSTPSILREDGWGRALRAAGRPLPPVLRGDWTPVSGYALGQRLAADPDVTAISCANDEMATGVLRALHEAGRRVPEDVSVTGFDDIPLAAHLHPPLTTVLQDFTAIGHALVEMLLRQVRSGTLLSDERVVVAAPLVVRNSTGPAPAR
ncbi:LacI family DNA-binding transcriptional regulator [Cellulomonas endophytica]|uniref:LacI family DNA-binding transcriptional regulator n=1 Tax=Cellulomonas endophytica TaxID=2494735 RepID=UPI001011E1B4|nr:LacI family DNA-binding transcriptional regulator [Cellulomonas endophytica]